MKNNEIHLCMSCVYDFPDCPSLEHDVDYGDAVGCDNICACAKYEPYYTKDDNERLSQTWVITQKHGRLIDADALRRQFVDGDTYFTEEIDYEIKTAPTIIPASD